MKRIVNLIMIFIIILFCLTGCAVYDTNDGKIISKEYRPPYTSYHTQYIGNTTIRTPYTESEYYQFKIQKEIDEEICSKWIYVTKEEYDNYKIGDYYPRELDK